MSGAELERLFSILNDKCSDKCSFVQKEPREVPTYIIDDGRIKYSSAIAKAILGRLQTLENPLAPDSEE